MNSGTRSGPREKSPPSRIAIADKVRTPVGQKNKTNVLVSEKKNGTGVEKYAGQASASVFRDDTIYQYVAITARPTAVSDRIAPFAESLGRQGNGWESSCSDHARLQLRRCNASAHPYNSGRGSSEQFRTCAQAAWRDRVSFWPPLRAPVRTLSTAADAAEHMCALHKHRTARRLHT